MKKYWSKYYEEINREMTNNKIKNMQNNFIKIYWVESHSESKYNDEVDVYAKISALLITYIADNERDKSLLFNPNNYISYNTVKSEIKYKIMKKKEQIWKQYKNERKNNEKSWSNHYYLWNISYSITFSKELMYLSKNQNNIRMMLYTNYISLNYFKHHFIENKKSTQYCNNKECNNNKKYEIL